MQVRNRIYMATKKEIDPRMYKPSDLKRLFALSGNECACPSCNRKLIARDGASIIGKVCHIEAASSDGPRYNIDQSNDERRSFDNLILLCDECHTIIDNPDNEAKYPVELLKRWKKDHESKYLAAILPQIPSCFKTIISAIVGKGIVDISGSKDLRIYKPEEKITYNALKRNRFLIEEYNVFTQPLHILYNELEEQGSFKKSILLAKIHTTYLRLKGKYAGDAQNPMIEIRKYADDIFDEIVDSILMTIENPNEEMLIATYIVVVDAFIECKILEKPQ